VKTSVAGIRKTERIDALKRDMPEVYAEFERIAQQLEAHYRDVQDLEFTIERGKLYMLQTRAAKRTAELIPFCHPLKLTDVDVEVAFEDTDGRRRAAPARASRPRRCRRGR